MKLWYSPGSLTPLLAALLEEAGWKRSDDPARWSLWLPSRGRGLESALRELAPAPNSAIGAISGCDSLADKRSLWIRLVKTIGRQAASEVMPETWLLDHPADQKRLMSIPDDTPLILKNPMLQKRRGLISVIGPKQALEHLGSGVRLAQREIQGPLLIDGHRFSLRCYLLVHLHKASLQAWLHHTGKALYASAPWSQGRSPESLLSRAAGVVGARPSSIEDVLEPLEIETGAFWKSLTHSMASLLRATRSELGHWQALRDTSSFQWFGVDVHLDSHFRAHILEANKLPDMRPMNEQDAERKRQVLRDFLSLVGVLEGPCPLSRVEAIGLSPT